MFKRRCVVDSFLWESNIRWLYVCCTGMHWSASRSLVMSGRHSCGKVFSTVSVPWYSYSNTCRSVVSCRRFCVELVYLLGVELLRCWTVW